MIKKSKNVSVILSPEPGYSLMQVRDDVEGNPIQFFGGWMKGFYPKYLGLEKEESIEHTIYREMVNELGLSLKEAFFLPFPIEDYISEYRGNDLVFYITKAIIKQEWIGNKKRIKPEEEVQGKLNLREGNSMNVFKLDESLLKKNLYGNDRRMFEIYLKHKDEIEQASFKLSLQNLYFPEKMRKELEELITVRA